MKKLLILILTLIIAANISLAQTKKQKYNINQDTLLYTIGYAHLDSQWRWDYPRTINEFLKNTLEDNFERFEKYPDYVFNFTGSRRYKMMKEYYPDMYKRMADYIAQGRWHISGSSVDECDVNVPSSESVIRQVLYGNNYFRKEFGKESVDFMLPDCFGFQGHLPSVWAHAGLVGFSTQKLSWKSANGIPFNVGVWQGPDGNSVIAALNATSYTSRIEERLDKSEDWFKRISENGSKYGTYFDFRYYGVGDVGGAPREEDVKNAVNSLNHKDSQIKVLLSSSDQMFKDITPEIRQKLPRYSGDLLLIEHSAGSITSQAFMKRSNRKNEFLAKSAEQLADMADWLGSAKYPFEKLNNSWELVLGSQMHDILPGTSILKAYEYSWNDEFIAMNSLSEVLKNSVSAISRELNTEAKGKSILVYNPVAKNRVDVVTAEIEYEEEIPQAIAVIDKDGKEVPSQILSRSGNKIKVIFLASVPSVGLEVYDMRPAEAPFKQNSILSITNSSLENEYYKVKVNSSGDIANIWDKKNQRELLSAPARLEFLHEHPEQWPAWNMDWEDRVKSPIDYYGKDAKIRIIENGPVRISLEIIREAQNSILKQNISLSAGKAGKRIEIENVLDWQSKGVSLKAAFPLTVSNEFATYNYGTGTIQRSNNHERKYEVPSKEWIDLSDEYGNYGVSILEDCKFGSDKPDDSTIRLTLLFTPVANSYYEQSNQDWGIHDFKYGIYGHEGDWRQAKTHWQARFLNQPLTAFETAKHDGKLGKSISLLELNSAQIGLMAFKKMEKGSYCLLRVNELIGQNIDNIRASFSTKVVDAYEVNGQEKKIGPAQVKSGSLIFDMTKYAIRSFAVKLAEPSDKHAPPSVVPIDLPYNEDGFSHDGRKKDGIIDNNGRTMAAEQIRDSLTCEDIQFKIGDTSDGINNMVACNGQQIKLPQGKYNKIYILASALNDTKGVFKIDDQEIKLGIQKWTGYVGQHYNRIVHFRGIKISKLEKAYSKHDNIAWFSSHIHDDEGKNLAYQYSYIYKYEIDIPEGTKTLTLPENKEIIIFAVSLAQNNNDNIKPLQPLYDDFRNRKEVPLRQKSMSYTEGIKPIVNIESVRMRRGMYESDSDYADIKSQNNVFMTYYKDGKESKLHHVFDASAKKEEARWSADGEGRYLIDLQNNLDINQIYIFSDRFTNRGPRVFSIWACEENPLLQRRPGDNNWDLIGEFVGSRHGFRFTDKTNYRYLLFVTEGSWHGEDFFNEIDIFKKEN